MRTGRLRLWGWWRRRRREGEKERDGGRESWLATGRLSWGVLVVVVLVVVVVCARAWLTTRRLRLGGSTKMKGMPSSSASPAVVNRSRPVFHSRNPCPCVMREISTNCNTSYNII